MMSENEEIDRFWETKLSQIKDREDIKKSIELLVIIARTGYDAHTRPFQRFYLQKIKVFIPDTPEFAPLYLSTIDFQPFYWKKIGKKEVRLMFHNLREGATQSIDLSEKSLAFSHARLKKIGKEKEISPKEASRMVREGLIHKVVPNDLIQKYSESWI